VGTTSDTNVLILRSTSATYQGDVGGRTGGTQKCLVEFPNTHFVHKGEVEMAYATGRGVIWMTSDLDATWVDSRLLGQNCSGNDPGKIWQNTQGLGTMVLPKGSGLATGPCTEAHPILCGTSKGN